jgi:hypothetical protein
MCPSIVSLLARTLRTVSFVLIGLWGQASCCLFGLWVWPGRIKRFFFRLASDAGRRHVTRAHAKRLSQFSSRWVTIAAYITMGWTSIFIYEPLRLAISTTALGLLFWGTPPTRPPTQGFPIPVTDMLEPFDDRDRVCAHTTSPALPPLSSKPES